MRNEKGQFVKGNKRPKEWTRIQTEKVSGDKNYAWKGERVGYRGLHQWLMRQLGKPVKCSDCRKVSERPRIIQWASKDGRYPRDPSHYIALCASCHKIYDLKIKSTRGGRSASR